MIATFPSGQPPSSQALKRSSSGREIVYLQQHRQIGYQPIQDPHPAQQPAQVTLAQIPPDVAQAFQLLRKYSYRDVFSWLRIDRHEGIIQQPLHFSLCSTKSNALTVAPEIVPCSSPFQVLGHSTSHSTCPSMVSSARTSRTSSLFSGPANYDRNSFASSRTSYSMMSERDQDCVMSPVLMNNGLVLDANASGHTNRISAASRASTSSNIKQAAKQRENELEIKKRYFCTACNKGFARKYDWKVHEQRYHEQQFQYPCPDCNQILYAETHFRSHHRDAHGCQQCTHAKDVTKEVDPRRRRTAWGCGFCSALLEDWEKRCDHISQHYDEGMKRSDWEHSKVILGLLRQEGIDAAWQSLLIAKHGHIPNPPLAVRFSKETTARSHGDSLQLQDLLELGAIGRDVNAIISLAYDQGVRNLSKLETDGPTQLDPVKEEHEAPSSSTPLNINDLPEDSVMGSPSSEGLTLVPASNRYATPSPMEFTSQHQLQVPQISRMQIDNSTFQMFELETTTFEDTMYQHSQFMTSNQAMLPHAEKALPPIPVENEVGMLNSHISADSHTPHFDHWPLIHSSTYPSDSQSIIPIFDPRNQI